MGIHLITILGTGLYEPVIYVEDIQNPTGKKQEYVQLALVDKYRDELINGGKLTVFLTNGAQKRNWENRTYTERDLEQSWIDDTVEIGSNHIGLQEQYETQNKDFGINMEVISIPDAKKQDEIWEIFEKMYECIEPTDEIVFDITHSFRSIPMLAMTVINYAKVLKGCKLKGIYYGAYEASSVINNQKIAPIWDMTVYNEILEWTSAAESFMRYGNVQHMATLYSEKMKMASNEEKRKWSTVNAQIKDLQNFTSDIATCRGNSAEKINGIKEIEKKSIRSAVAKINEGNHTESEEQNEVLIPLEKLMNKANESVSQFNTSSSFKTGCATIEWCIKHGMTQQAYTALEETIKTFLCEYYHLDEGDRKDREFFIGKGINSVKLYIDKRSKEKKELKKTNPELTDEEIAARFTDKEKTEFVIQENRNTQKDGYESWDDERQKQFIQYCLDLPEELVKICSNVKDERNDINHFGFRKEPKKCDALQKNISENYQKFLAGIEKMQID